MHVLFDLDGTLTDSQEGICRCMGHALTALGRPCPAPAVLTRFIGIPLADCFATLLETTDEARIQQAIGVYRERFADRGLYENCVYPGIPEALSALRSLDLDLWVVTAKPQVFAEKVLEHFDLRGYFRGVYGPPLDGERTYKAELIRGCLASTGIRRGETVMVGDRRDDVLGGRKNGIATLGVLWGYGARDELEVAGPDALVESPAQLVQALAALAASSGAGGS
jgi:phosphoglycolate phosphatase